MATTAALSATLLVIDALDHLGVEYHVGGSLASSLHGDARQTRDVDIVAALGQGHASRLAALLAPNFYVDEAMMLDAIRHGTSFNAVHLSTGFKIDVLLPADTDFDELEFKRRCTMRVQEEPPRDIYVKSPEDTILRKLLWYREGGEVSDRQWNDVRGVLENQRGRLDLVYLRRWSERLGVADLLIEALEESK
jgi:hypothetical protein